MNSEFVSYLEHKVEESAKKLQAVNDQIQQLSTDRETLMGDIEGYKRTLVAERRGTSSYVPSMRSDDDDDALGGDEARLGSKADFARQFIRARANFGATPSDLLHGFQSAGINISRAYVYSLVQRLKKQEAIRQRRGKWFPVDLPTATNGAQGAARIMGLGGE